MARSRPKGRLPRRAYMQLKARLVDEQFEEFGYNHCIKCGASYPVDKAADFLHLHHLKHRSLGGNDDPNNLELTCGKCHADEHGVNAK